MSIGALVVSADGKRLDGTLSERDIIHALADDGAAAFALRDTDPMTRWVVTCAFGGTLAELMDGMTRSRIRHLPVVEQGWLVGLVSIGGVVKNLLDKMEYEAAPRRAKSSPAWLNRGACAKKEIARTEKGGA